MMHPEFVIYESVETEQGGWGVRISLLYRLTQHPLVKTIKYARIQAYLNILPENRRVHFIHIHRVSSC